MNCGNHCGNHCRNHCGNPQLISEKSLCPAFDSVFSEESKTSLPRHHAAPHRCDDAGLRPTGGKGHAWAVEAVAKAKDVDLDKIECKTYGKKTLMRSQLELRPRMFLARSGKLVLGCGQELAGKLLLCLTTSKTTIYNHNITGITCCKEGALGPKRAVRRTCGSCSACQHENNKIALIHLYTSIISNIKKYCAKEKV